VIKNGQLFAVALEMAAETHDFAPKWGGWQIHTWTKQWLKTRDLPKLLKGSHAKLYSLLNDPVVVAELRTYISIQQMGNGPQKTCLFLGEQTHTQCCGSVLAITFFMKRCPIA
jgi:hypothetical protein